MAKACTASVGLMVTKDRAKKVQQTEREHSGWDTGIIKGNVGVGESYLSGSIVVIVFGYTFYKVCLL